MRHFTKWIKWANLITKLKMTTSDGFLNFSKPTSIPLVVVVGSTGTGKSQLAIEIAKRFDGEIISADSMQVYRDLDIITNKVTEEEQQGVKHHLLGYVDPKRLYTVREFRDDALPIVNKLLAEKKLPVIVGGTNYYIESLLWKVLVNKENECISSNTDSSEDDEVESEILYSRLLEVDPVMAKKIHPNDKRKIKRSLEVFDSLGRRHSDIINEQKNQEGGNSLGAPLRFMNSCIIWIQTEQSVLEERLEKRVDAMVKQGLVNELIKFQENYRTRANRELDYTRGLLQSIGFKEFHDYLNLTDEERSTDAGQKALEDGINRLKQVTKRYSKKQIKWIKNRFLRKPDRPVPPIYSVDSSNVKDWTRKVHDPAMDIVEAHIDGRACGIDPLPIDREAQQYEQRTYYCEICETTFLGELQWEIHNTSRRHKKRLQSKKKCHSSIS